MEVYFDNAATSYPKPDIVYDKMSEFFKNNGVSAGRGAYQKAFQAEQAIFGTRKSLAQLFNVSDPTRIVFTHNVTEAINLALKGLLEAGDHVITTSLEHNAIWRPLKELERDRGIEITKIECNSSGQIDIDEIENEIKDNTKLIACLHASNVVGTILPAIEMGKIAKGAGIYFLLDTAQTAGVYPIDVQEMNIDFLAFTGHKGLLGPTGTGGLYISEGIDLKPLKTGGTGNNSTSEYAPKELPNRYEAGTINTVGLIGLGAGVEYILDTGIKQIRAKEVELIEYALTELEKIEGLILYGEKGVSKRVGVISFNLEGLDHAEVAYKLDSEYSIMVRSGLHCAPNAHKTISSFELGGAVRIGIGYFNTKAEIDYLIKALQEIK
ncbi:MULTISPECIES: aminotransferase class V-fold PLP-dependent enzyme [unclassified Candidatus Frackibacter]|uniref:aminotransferase class V-fold PLP-dependent enzyme n=1 Tax=unclassified Candidatus Frackibacter TaxID=2648818 RepID=UPI0008801F3A|nr:MULTISPECIES: aminotransferase class V-fold PLP-dependent enzyme [unclassified Candidatus Frackibacter]SDC00285.1 cysteine desulfurase family protein [Candidatus Frackibacter sp. WG11]SEM31787.1 cysteine desulfurase family protein [Candidatus Frackibacter sp. WG12]SFL36700.1 cysteine desulfurase family protein [Candidatus Frackibacter sp. WG13]